MKFIIVSVIDILTRLIPTAARLSFSRILRWLSIFVERDRKMVDQINAAMKASYRGDYDTAEKLLETCALEDITDTDLALYLALVKFLRERSMNKDIQKQTQDMLDTINEMNAEIKSKEVYIPGEFWNQTGHLHLDLLKLYGVENFKRTVSHHYQNWFMTNKKEPQVAQLYKLWSKHQSLQPWMNTIETPTHMGFNSDLMLPRYPLADKSAREVYGVAVGLLYEYVNHTDHDGVLAGLSESEVGNPIRVWRNGELISSDLAHSVRERSKLFKTLDLKGDEGLVIGELGAGHGRLAETFGKTTNFRHIIIDITPALFVSQWYVQKIFPDEKIFAFRPFDDFEDIREELDGCRFAFFTSNQIEKIPTDYLDIFINFKSLAEMQKRQVDNFLDQIGRVTSKAFFSSQQIESKNPVEKESFTTASFAMSPEWELLLDEIDDVYPAYFNQIWSKK